MSTIQELIEGFLYPHLEKYTACVYKYGEDTVIKGIRVLDDPSKFTHGALVKATAMLYTHYEKNGDPRADEALKRLNDAIRLASGTVCKTWGKLGVLRGINLLYENHLLHKVDKNLIEQVKVRTEYDDFLDKESLTLKGMANNYYQVAMACAGYRERFGWENDGIAERIKEKFTKIIIEDSPQGWMDDEPPYGRFDRYSLILSSEFYDTATDISLEAPKEIIDNLRSAANVALFMANDRGDGVD